MILPELGTSRLRLVPPSADLIEHYIEFFTDAEASRSYGGPLSEAQSWSRLAHDRGIWHLRGFGVWIITARGTGRVHGGCGFWQGRGWPRELTWWLLPDSRGRGFAREASEIAIQHAYHQWQWPTVQTYMEDANESARALTIRLGGQDLGRHTFPDDVERTIYGFPRPDGSYPDNPDLSWD